MDFLKENVFKNDDPLDRARNGAQSGYENETSHKATIKCSKRGPSGQSMGRCSARTEELLTREGDRGLQKTPGRLRDLRRQNLYLELIATASASITYSRRKRRRSYCIYASVGCMPWTICKIFEEPGIATLQCFGWCELILSLSRLTKHTPCTIPVSSRFWVTRTPIQRLQHALSTSHLLFLHPLREDLTVLVFDHARLRIIHLDSFRAGE